jgi:hypothetical protein
VIASNGDAIGRYGYIVASNVGRGDAKRWEKKLPVATSMGAGLGITYNALFKARGIPRPVAHNKRPVGDIVVVELSVRTAVLRVLTILCRGVIVSARIFVSMEPVSYYCSRISSASNNHEPWRFFSASFLLVLSTFYQNPFHENPMGSG